MSDTAYDRDWRGRAERAEAEIERLKNALGEIAALGERCEDCDPPDTIATHVTACPMTGIPVFLCAEHAEDARAANRRVESKGCRNRPDVEVHEQETAVSIALAALTKGAAK